MEELGNTFEEDSEDLLVLDSKEIADTAAVEAVKKAQFQTFTKESLVERTKPQSHNPPQSVETVCW